jgi:uncharacterized protein with HEPN domain
MQRHIKNDMLYLLRIMEAAQKIQLYAASFADWESFYFSNDQLEFNACLNQLGQVGEQAKKISDTLTDKYNTVFWQKIKGFRNRIIHEYIGVDTENVFQIIQHDIPALYRHIIPIIMAEIELGNFDREEFEIAKTSPYLKHIDFTLLS